MRDRKEEREAGRGEAGEDGAKPTLSEEEALAFDFLGTIQDGFELFLGRFECVVDVDTAEVVGEGGACFHAHEREGLVQLAPAYAPRVQRFEGLRVESASLLTALAHSLDQSAHRVGLRELAGQEGVDDARGESGVKTQPGVHDGVVAAFVVPGEFEEDALLLGRGEPSAHERVVGGEVDGPGHAGVLGHGGEKIRDDPVCRTGALIDVVSERRGHSG